MSWKEHQNSLYTNCETQLIRCFMAFFSIFFLEESQYFFLKWILAHHSVPTRHFAYKFENRGFTVTIFRVPKGPALFVTIPQFATWWHSNFSIAFLGNVNIRDFSVIFNTHYSHTSCHKFTKSADTLNFASLLRSIICYGSSSTPNNGMVW